MITNRNIGADAQISPSKIMGGGALGLGTVFFVAPTTSTVYQSWLDSIPNERLCTTVLAAYNKTVSGRNDVIVLSPDSHELTVQLNVAKNRVHFVGGDVSGRFFGQRAKIVLNTDAAASTSPGVVKVTGVGCSFTGIKFINGVDTITNSKNVLLDGGEYSLYKNCEFYLEAVTQATTTGLAEVVANGDSSTFIECTFGSLAQQVAATAITRPCILLDGGTVTGGATPSKCRDNYIKDCLFWRKAGHVNNAFIYGANATDIERMLLVENCKFINSTLASADPAAAFLLVSAQTEGTAIMLNCSCFRTTILKTASKEIYTQSINGSYATMGLGIIS